MPVETKQAVDWALTQSIESDGFIVPVTKDEPHLIVDMVRKYFNDHGIPYSTFSYDDLVEFLN